MSAKWYQNKDGLKNLAIALLIIAVVGIYWRIDGYDRLENYAIENSPMSAAEFLDIFEIDSKEACKEPNKNKYGVPEAECITRIQKYSYICKQKAVEKFQGKMNTIEKMLLVGNFFTSCVFSDEQEISEAQP